MDDEPDGAVSRAPELEDLVALCRALNREGVRYLLIGGFAVILHGFVRTTKDVDLLVDPSDTNVAALKRALAWLPDNAAAEIRDADVRQYTVVRVADEIVVDLMASACGMTYEERPPVDWMPYATFAAATDALCDLRCRHSADCRGHKMTACEGG